MFSTAVPIELPICVAVPIRAEATPAARWSIPLMSSANTGGNSAPMPPISTRGARRFSRRLPIW